ncbi:MAG: hypothetical protein ABIR79_11675 [Candidatus Binatia bacterium]
MTTKRRQHVPLLSRTEFALRVAKNAMLGLGLIVVSLAIGVVGYHVTAGLGWVDSLLNASMILTGMGPVDELQTDGAKIFASFYALFSGVAFLTIVAVLMAPLVHRFLHRFHLELADQDEDQK